MGVVPHPRHPRMLVRALRSFASPYGAPAAGDLIDVPHPVAVEWVRVGLVERADQTETTTRLAPETAVTRKARR